MTIALRQSTASQEIPLGHFVDSTDGVTAETGLTIANTDIKIWKAGATTLANKNSGGATHISNGVYYAVLDATDTNTVGSLVIFVAVSGALAVRLECQVYEEAIYDALFAASAAGYSTLDAAGVRTAVGLASANLDTQLSTIDTVVDDILADLNAFTGDVGASGAGLTALPWNAAWDAQVQSEVQDAIEANHLDHLLAVDYDPTSKPGVATALLNELVESDGGVSRFTANALEQGPSGGGASASAIADAVWDEALSGHLSAGSTGEALNAAGSAGDPWTTTLPGSYTGSQAGKMLSDVLTDTGTTLQAELDGIQADTEDIQSRLPAALVGGRIDANVGAISADATAADNAEAFFDGTGYAGTGNVIPTVTSVTGIASGGITAASIATGAIDADALAADAVDEILDEVVESTITLRQVCRLILSMMNKTTRSGSTIYFRDVADTKNRIAITIDSNADRTAVTRDLT